MEERLERILGRVGRWLGGEPVLTPLPGGITNRNYRVNAGGESFVLRLGGEGARLLGIDRRNEFAVSSIAARLGVGAEVLSFIEEEDALLTCFVEGATMTPEAASRPEVLERIVRSIRLYHEGPAFPGEFSPFATVRAYRALALERGVKFPDRAALALETLARIEGRVSPPARLVPCHNDLLAGNFIDDGRAIRILDWEYAAMGDPFFDLGNFAANQRLEGRAVERLLELYEGAARPESLARLSLLRLASDLRESFWGFLQSGVSKIEFDFIGYAGEHLDRFLERTARPELETWLRALPAGGDS
ncbi:MAG TPA: choline/ethanolamine kinase family protein [Planctomycetota bacterium]|nr:choline/ethanolamine kinase family protein [Planctomycetota bacterium]